MKKHRLEIALKPDLFDAEGNKLRQKALNYFGIDIAQARVVNVITIDAALSSDQLKTAQKEIFTNPVTHISSFDPIDIEFDWIIWVGYRAGVRDNPGSTAVEAIEDILSITFGADESVYTSKRYCLKGSNLTYSDVKKIATELLANDIIEQWKIYSADKWDPSQGTGINIPKVILNHDPVVTTIPVDSDKALQKISQKRNLALNPNDIPNIRSYFSNKNVQKNRGKFGLSDPTDVELEYISQARSDHCNHNTFQGLFRYYDDASTSKFDVYDNLFDICIKNPTLKLMKEKPWVVSVLWDNAGAGRFDANHNYVITGETHNSPSNIEAYGGALTGIVGVYRDPMGTGKGTRLIMGSYGFCVGHDNYKGHLMPRLHPRRLLDGVIEGVRDGGNKSGIPTTFGQVQFHSGYMGKCLVFVTALGIMPCIVNNEPGHQKTTSPGDLVVMCGGKVGKDGIHGVTASSEIFSKNTPAGHVQIGDPYTQKKMHDFLLEVRDKGLIQFITDNGGGGLSSSIGESARFSNGCEIQLDKVPLKYVGLDQWEIWISESQERMTIAVLPEHLDLFMELSKKHAVESTVIGKYTDSGKLHITYVNKSCAYIDIDLIDKGFKQWEFEARWSAPEKRGLKEPVFSEPKNYNKLLPDMLSRPNICSKEWITRQYDHEVQGTSVVKPLIGAHRDINSDGVVIKPVYDSIKGIAFAQTLLPAYSAIDTYHMTTCTVDEAVRRLISVGADFEHIGGVDNYCWPNIQFHTIDNPDGKYKAAQLVRSCLALRDICLYYGIPLLSGKDSMYVDGNLAGQYGETHKISALPTLQFSSISVVEDVTKCITMDCKVENDLVYIIGTTKNELGGSEYYEHMGYVGLNVPKVEFDKSVYLYKALALAIKKSFAASAHGIYRGGLGIHLAMVAMGGDLGMEIDLGHVPACGINRNDFILFSESAGRFIVTVMPEKRKKFENVLKNTSYACIGKITKESNLIIKGIEKNIILDVPLKSLKTAWQKPFKTR